jgi:Epoxide hydrolase N terminus
LRSRISATKWPDREIDPSQGVRLETIQALAGYWATDYDWRKFEERFAALPHFITEIDGVDIHFIHVRSEHEDALPLIVTHGWPGSTIEQLKIMIDHDVRSYELIARAFTGQAGGLSRDDVLDNVTHYWLTNTAISSARLYWESKLAFFDAKGVEIPVGVTVFPDELYPAPQSWAERAYPKLIHFNKVDEGGHFAAWEQPQTFSEEIRATFRSLR